VDAGAQKVIVDHHGPVRIGTRNEVSTANQETQILNEPVWKNTLEGWGLKKREKKRKSVQKMLVNITQTVVQTNTPFQQTITHITTNNLRGA